MGELAEEGTIVDKQQESLLPGKQGNCINISDLLMKLVCFILTLLKVLAQERSRDLSP